VLRGIEKAVAYSSRARGPPEPDAADDAMTSRQSLDQAGSHCIPTETIRHTVRDDVVDHIPVNIPVNFMVLHK
jgi:hypothetical protein